MWLNSVNHCSGQYRSLASSRQEYLCSRYPAYECIRSGWMKKSHLSEGDKVRHLQITLLWALGEEIANERYIYFHLLKPFKSAARGDSLYSALHPSGVEAFERGRYDRCMILTCQRKPLVASDFLVDYILRSVLQPQIV